jgi:hypothetical protein
MALTRAQLLSGNNSFGITLPGQTQGVTQGTGLIIAANGQISFDSATAVGIMRLNNPGAYNAYVWPGVDGAAGNQLTTDGAGNLVWTASGTPTYTAKGQIEAATGAGTSALLNVGANTSFLIADSTTSTGLIYSGSSTSAAQMPAGNTGARPNPATPGQIRFNSATGKFEFATGATSWEEVASGDPTVSGFVSQSVPSAPAGATGNALIPAGTTAQRQVTPAPVDGSMRFNTTTGELEVSGPSGWKTVPSSTTGAFAAQTVPTAPATATANVVVPGGSTTDRQTAPAVTAGQMRFNTTTGKLEVYGGGGAWETLPSSTSGAFVGQTIPVAGQTASAVIPTGTTGQQQTPALAGYARFNTDTFLMEVFNGTAWVAIGSAIQAGLGINLSGTAPNEVYKASTPVQFGPPTAGTLPAEAIDGSTYWDDTLGVMFIRYFDGTSTQWVQTNPSGGGGGGTYTGTAPIVVTGTVISANAATTGAQGVVQIGTNVQVAAGTISVFDSTNAQKGVIEIATQAEAITGTDATLASTPATAVAKTTADQTGFVVTPKSAAAPTTTGYLHYNTTSNHLEYFAASAAKTALEREGDNMTGKLSVTPSAIAAGVGGWLLTTSNYWTVGAIAFPLPTGLSAGQGGLIQMSAAPTSWPAAGGILKYTGGTAPAPTAFPALLPYYSDGTNVYLGKATEGIS